MSLLRYNVIDGGQYNNLDFSGYEGIIFEGYVPNAVTITGFIPQTPNVPYTIINNCSGFGGVTIANGDTGNSNYGNQVMGPNQEAKNIPLGCQVTIIYNQMLGYWELFAPGLLPPY